MLLGGYDNPSKELLLEVQGTPTTQILQKNGQLPPKNVGELTPWSTVHSNILTLMDHTQ